MPHPLTCRAKACKNEPIPGGLLCDYCQGEVDEGRHVPMKNGPVPGKPRGPYKTLAKRRSSPEWQKIREAAAASLESSRRRRGGPRPACAAPTYHGNPCRQHASYGPFCYWHRHTELPHA